MGAATEFTQLERTLADMCRETLQLLEAKERMLLMLADLPCADDELRAVVEADAQATRAVIARAQEVLP